MVSFVSSSTPLARKKYQACRVRETSKVKKNLNGRALSKFGIVYQNFSKYLHWYQTNILKKTILKFSRGVPNDFPKFEIFRPPAASPIQFDLLATIWQSCKNRLILPKNDTSVKHCSGRVK